MSADTTPRPPQVPLPRGVITMAFGAVRYINEAVVLAQSLALAGSTTPRAVVTDSDDPRLRRWFDVVVPLRPEWGKSMEHKLRLPDYTPFTESLYIDADCIAVRDESELWDMLSGVPVGVITGQNQRTGTWLGGDIATVLGRLGAPGPLPVINGGVVYMRAGEVADRIFARARDLLTRYSDLGFADVKGRAWTASDEPALALALAMEDIPGVNDHGRGMRTLIKTRGRSQVNVRTGASAVRKQAFTARPVLVHFAHTGTKHLLYRRERRKVTALAGGGPAWPWVPVDLVTDAALGAWAATAAPARRWARQQGKKVLVQRAARSSGPSPSPSPSTESP